MRKIVVTCPKAHRLEAEEGLAGLSLPCPGCGEVVIVPPLESNEWGETVSDLETPAADTVTPTSGNAQASDRRHWLPRLVRGGVRLSLGVMRIVVLTLLCLAVLWFVLIRGSGDAAVMRKLREIGLAFQMFHEAHRAYGFARLQDKTVLEPNRQTQSTALSWRVHLLPYLEQRALYEKFHLDEPWDSPHNISLVKYMPEVYRLSGGGRTNTRFRVLTGPNMFFGNETPPSIGQAKDGTRSTILAVVVDKSLAVTWTQPDDLPVAQEDPLAVLGNISGKYIATVAVDGHPLMLPSDIEPERFYALATPRGKEIIDGEMYRREYADANPQIFLTLLKQFLGH